MGETRESLLGLSRMCHHLRLKGSLVDRPMLYSRQRSVK
jgi:hypothetical protein